MNKHTPGPWMVVKQVKPSTGLLFGIVPLEGDDDRWIGRLIADGASDVENVDANARLIAAAPCMLEALKHSHALIESMTNAMPEGYFEKNSADSKFVGSTLVMVSAAIAKAEGRV